MSSTAIIDLMEITDDDVAEYQQLYRARFSKEIDKQTAWQQLTLLVRQMEIVYQPITRQQYEEYTEHHDS